MNAPAAACLQGALTIVACQQQHEALAAAVQACEGELVLDLSAIDVVDSAGVQLLLAARHSLTVRGATLRLRPVSRAVVDVLSLYGLHAVLPWTADASDATEAQP